MQIIAMLFGCNLIKIASGAVPSVRLIVSIVTEGNRNHLAVQVLERLCLGCLDFVTGEGQPGVEGLVRIKRDREGVVMNGGYIFLHFFI